MQLSTAFFATVLLIASGVFGWELSSVAHPPVLKPVTYVYVGSCGGEVRISDSLNDSSLRGCEDVEVHSFN